jgi:hypothetical protein
VEEIIKSVREDDEDFDVEQLKESGQGDTGQGHPQGQHPLESSGHFTGVNPAATRPSSYSTGQAHGHPPHPPAGGEVGSNPLLSTMGGGLVGTLGTQALTSRMQNLKVSHER